MFENPENVKKYNYIVRISYELTNAYEYDLFCSKKPHTINVDYDIHFYNQYGDFDISNPLNPKTLELIEEYKTKFMKPDYIDQRFHVKDTFFPKNKSIFCFNLFAAVEHYYVCDLQNIKLTQVEIIVDEITPLCKITPKELFSQLDFPSCIQLVQYYAAKNKTTTHKSDKPKKSIKPENNKTNNKTSNVKIENSSASISNDKIKIIRAISPKTLTKKKKNDINKS